MKLRFSLFFILIIFFSNTLLAQTNKKPINLLYISIDGLSQRAIYTLIQKQRLPGISKIIERGNYRNMGLSKANCSLRNYSSLFTGTDQNSDANSSSLVKPLTKGSTIFEQLKKRFPELSISVCISKATESKNSKNISPLLSNAKNSIDLIFPEKIRDSNEVGKISLNFLKVAEEPFFMFLNFTDVEKAAIDYREGGQQYSWALERCDWQIERIIDYLKANKMWDNTEIIITTNYGYQKNSKQIAQDDDIWIISTQKIRYKGSHLDIAPTIYEIYDLFWKSVKVPLIGKPLIY